MSDFVQFYDNSWKDLFLAVININNELNLNKFAEEGKLIELKIAQKIGQKIGKEMTSDLANIALFYQQLSVLLWLKENNILVSFPFEIELVKKPNFRLLKFLDTHNLFNQPEKVANALVREGRIQLLNGLTIRNLVSIQSNETNESGVNNKLSLWQKYKTELENKFMNDNTIDFRVPSDLPNKFLLADPEEGKNVEWIIKSYINGGIRLYEDLLTQVKPALEDWLYLKRNKYITKSQNPFTDYTTLINICGVQGCDMRRQGKMYGYPGLYEIIKPFNTILAERDKEIAEKLTDADYKEIYNDEDFRVIQPLSVKGSCYYGMGTRWCTSARDDNQFTNYNNEGPLYTILPKAPTYIGEKYQLHIETDSLMNELDKDISTQELIKRHPKIINIPVIKFYSELKDAIEKRDSNAVIELSYQLPTKIAFNYALDNNLFDLIKYLMDKGISPDKETSIKIEKILSSAITNNNFDVANFYLSLSPPILPDKDDIIDTARKGKLEMLKLIYAACVKVKNKKYLFDEYVAAAAGKGKHIEILNWLLSLNPSVYVHDWAIENFVQKNNLPVLEWLASLSPPRLPNVYGIYHAITGNHLDVLKLIAKYQPELVLNKSSAKTAKENNKTEILDWLASYGIIP